MSKRTTKPGRRLATFVAAVGALVMSSGVAMLATAQSAHAEGEAKYFVCKYVGTPGVDEVLQTGDNPISVAASAIAEDPVQVGSFFNDQHGRSYVLVEDTGQAEPSVDQCPPPTPPNEEIAVDIVFVDPSCDNDNTASYSLTGDTGDVTVGESAAPAPGVEVTVTATAKTGFEFAGGDPTYSETHTFGPAADCEVNPPVVTPPDNTPPAVTPPVVSPPVATPTVVHAGLVGTTADNARSEQGLALLGSGLLLLMAAGGLARPRRVRS